MRIARSRAAPGPRAANAATRSPGAAGLVSERRCARVAATQAINYGPLGAAAFDPLGAQSPTRAAGDPVD